MLLNQLLGGVLSYSIVDISGRRRRPKRQASPLSPVNSTLVLHGHIHIACLLIQPTQLSARPPEIINHHRIGGAVAKHPDSRLPLPRRPAQALQYETGAQHTPMRPHP